MKGKSSERTFNSNRKAWCKSKGPVYLDSITEIDVDAHISWRRILGCGPQTIRHDIKILTLLFNKIRRWRKKKIELLGLDLRHLALPEENPTSETRLPKVHPRQRIITPNEFSRLIEHSTDRLTDCIYFAIDTGLNEIDLRRLKVSDYCAISNTVTINRHKTGKQIKIPLTKRCRAIVMSAKLRGQEFVLNFVNQRYDWDQARKNAGVDCQWRDLRKSMANIVYEKSNHDIKPVQKLLGHVTPLTTWNHYIVDDISDIKAIVDKIPEYYCGK